MKIVIFVFCKDTFVQSDQYFKLNIYFGLLVLLALWLLCLKFPYKQNSDVSDDEQYCSHDKSSTSRVF